MGKIVGLTSTEVKKLFATWGPNELPSSKRKPLWLVALGVFREPMLLLLLAGAFIYFFLGKPEDSVLLLCSMAFIVGIAIYQEQRSTRALEALKDLSSPRALVIRDGIECAVVARELVPGDHLLVKEGERVAADCRVVQSSNLEADESLLTGESQPVVKQAGNSLIFSGTLITSGHGEAQVVATGLHTEVGKIGKSLLQPDESKTRLQGEIAVLARNFGILAIAFSFLILLAYGITRGNWAQGLLAGIAAAMSLLPEEFPVILTIFLALGAWRLSKQRVLVRQTAATENLGGVTVLCVDKTGTLTKNQMTVGLLRTPTAALRIQEDLKESLTEDFSLLLKYAVLASQMNPFDPMEKALHRLLVTKSSVLEKEIHSLVLEKQYPLSPQLLAMSHVWREDGKKTSIIAMKGAPEAVLDLCDPSLEFIASIRAQVEEMSRQGFRVLGVARAEWAEAALPIEQTNFHFQFLGLLGFVDPLRPGVIKAVQECDAAGVRVIMITGDHPGTACKIAEDIALRSPKTFLTGSDLEKMPESELQESIGAVNVFARMIPSQKLRIVNALKARGEVVGMTGDGVNDAPSLKWADIGIAMGGRGTDVARESADLVILDDDFNSIVGAIRLGRRIFDNISRAMSFIFATHFPIAALAIVPVLLGLPLVLFPAHIVFLELIIDPTCTLIFEAEEADANTMKRPPRKLNQRLFGFKDIFFSSLQGAVVFAGVLSLFMVALSMGLSENHSRTLAFMAFVLSNIGLILVNEIPSMLIKNRYFWIVLLFTFGALVAVISVPTLRMIFGLEVPSLFDVFLAVLVASGSTLVSMGIYRTLKKAGHEWNGTKSLRFVQKIK